MITFIVALKFNVNKEMNWSQTHFLQPPILFYRFSEWATIASVSPFLWIFEKCIELQFLLFETLFCFFLVLMTWQIPEKHSFFARRKNAKEQNAKECAKDYFCKNNFRCKRYSVQCFHFWKRKTNWFWRKYVKRKLFSGIILYGAPNKPKVYLELSRTSAMDLFLQK